MKDDSSETRENHSSDLSSKRLCHEHGDDCPSENEREFESLEYEEDVYYSKLAATPSFDDIDELSVNEEIIMHCWKDSNCELDEIIVDDTDLAFVEGQEGTRRMRRSIRIIFQEFSKSYLEKFSRGQKKLMERLKGEDALHSGLNSGLNSPSMDNIANELAGMTPEQQEEQKEEWRRELAKVEEEIQTLRHVLSSKVRVSQELKRKLGITVWKDITDDVNQGIRNVKESQVFQRTESVCKQAAGLTTSILGGFGSGITMKLGQMRNSDSFRSLEEKVGSAYENVKGKVTPSRSTSTQSFDEALREAEASRRASGAPSAATSPTIPEEKLLS
ncbi:uncharacterized protein [Fopius arisanus]|uniref:Uncharacterized protein isoform X2 n=1 Tax=Fopius arisanus TaxID=64838 RepID=A0A9R1TYK3_9HYME|nr:PREDICTED: uncharacterized protein LOC105265343 isoform X2 [Fopius arisanus]